MFQPLLEKIAQGLDARGVPYMVIGGQAVLIYGEPRLTKDIDVTLGIGAERAQEIWDMAAHWGWQILVPSPLEFVRRTMVLPCVEPESGIRIDLIFSWSPYERQAIERARRVRIGQAQVRFAAPEDVIVHKIIAGRPRDLEDVRVLLLRVKDLDRAYVRSWLEQFQAALDERYVARWQEVLKAVDEPDE